MIDIPFLNPYSIEEYSEEKFSDNCHWVLLCIATSKYNAEVILMGLHARYPNVVYRINEVKA